MKKAFLSLAIFHLALAAHAQGTIQFSNSNLPGPTPGSTYEAYITRAGAPNGGNYLGDYGPGVYTAGLFQEGSVTPLTTTTFFSGTGPDQQFNYIFLTEPQVAVDGIAPGQTGRFFVAAWRTSDGSFAASTDRAQSAVFTSRPLGGQNPTPGELPFTTPVTTFQSFAFLPEPTTTTLAALGLTALLLRRRS